MRDSEIYKSLSIMKGVFIMGRKVRKISSDIKLEYAQQCFEGKLSISEVAQFLNVNKSIVGYWVLLYEVQGPSVFMDTGRNQVHSPEFKLEAIQCYLGGEDSYRIVAAKFGLKTESLLKQWVKMYNNGEDSTRKMSGGSHMKTARSTTHEERIEIAKHCLKHDKNYGATAKKYNVSYAQVYNWVKRYIELGEPGLEDRRGKRKDSQVGRSEKERLDIENAQLKHENEMLKMEVALLKKVKELERKHHFRK